MGTVLAVDDDRAIRHMISAAFADTEHDVELAEDVEVALQIIRDKEPEVVLLDIDLPEISGFEAFDKIKALDSKLPVIYITGGGTSSTAIEAMKLGAFDYLLKPLDLNQLRDLTDRAIEIRRLMNVPVALASAVSPADQGDQIVGRSPEIQEVFKAIGRVAPQNVTVLIRGESGTGKELVARAIYQHGAAVAAYAVNSLQLLQCAESENDVEKELQLLANECHRRLSQSARKNPDERGMATTLTLAIVIWPRLYVMHIGDSRCYLVRKGKAEQLTRDHTLAQLYTEYGEDINVSEGASHVLWNVVSSQSDADLVADVIQRELQEGDQLLLCTDGLYKHVNEESMLEVLEGHQSSADCCNEFVQRANTDGGKDNITVVLSRFNRVCGGSTPETMVETRIPLMDALPAREHLGLDDTDNFIPQLKPTTSNE